MCILPEFHEHEPTTCALCLLVEPSHQPFTREISPGCEMTMTYYFRGGMACCSLAFGMFCAAANRCSFRGHFPVYPPFAHAEKAEVLT